MAANLAAMWIRAAEPEWLWSLNVGHGTSPLMVVSPDYIHL
jgi:hypothetical protein